MDYPRPLNSLPGTEVLPYSLGSGVWSPLANHAACCFSSYHTRKGRKNAQKSALLRLSHLI